MKEISLHILDLVQNSVRAGAASIAVTISEDCAADTFRVAIEDDGCGMDKAMARAVLNPFVTTRTTRKVGLGIPLFAAGCENCGGTVSLKSEPGRGTRIEGCYQRSHIDRPPLGDIADTIALLIGANPSIRFRYAHSVDENAYALDTEEIKQILGEVPLDTPEVVAFMKEFIQSNEFELYRTEQLTTMEVRET